MEVPPRAIALRAAMAELERIHNHLNDWGFVLQRRRLCPHAARCGFLREGVLRACERLRPPADDGPRAPGGVAADMSEAGRGDRGYSPRWRAVERIVRLYESHASLQDRVVGTGFLNPACARLRRRRLRRARLRPRFDARRARLCAL